MKFSSKIIPVSDRDTRSSFPERFSNEVYISRTSHFGPVVYTSNFSLKYGISGECQFVINGLKQTVKSGSMLMVNDGTHVECTSKINEEGLSIFLDKKLVNEVHSHLQSSQNLLLECNDPLNNLSSVHFYDRVFGNDCNYLLRSRVASLVAQYKQSDLIITSSFYYELVELLLLTQADIKIKLESINKSRPATRKEIFCRVQLVKEYLDNTLNCRFDLNTLSKVAALSKFHLIRCFKEVYHTTPQKYFILKKVEMAKQLLKHSSVTDVAQQLKYRDIHSFSRQFKLTTGVSPTKLQNL